MGNYTQKYTYNRVVQALNDQVFHGLMQMIKLIHTLTAELSISLQLVDFMTGHEVNGIEAKGIMFNNYASCHRFEGFDIGSSNAVWWSLRSGLCWETLLVIWDCHTIILIKFTPISGLICARIIQKTLNCLVFILPRSEAWIPALSTAPEFLTDDFACWRLQRSCTLSSCTLKDDCRENHNWLGELHCWLLLIGIFWRWKDRWFDEQSWFDTLFILEQNTP